MKQFDFEDKVKEMVFNLNQDLTKECIRLFNCGGVDPEDYDSDYMLPKIILTVALENLSEGFIPLTKEGKATANNLKHF